VATIFLSYRRQDSADICDRLSDHLCRRYGRERVFRDVSTILVGSAFPQALRLALEDCRAMVVVIGPDWLNARDARGMRRLDDPLDWVRIEVATGLREGKLVIPVLVRGASLPAPQDLPEDLHLLAECHPIVLRSGPLFLSDMDGLFHALGSTARGGPPHRGLLVCGAATFLALLALMIAVALPTLASAEAIAVLANEHLVEVAIGLEILRVVGTRRWVWLLVPIASSALQIASYPAGIFSFIIILFTLCALPFVMGTLGPPASMRPLGIGTNRGWRIVGAVVVASSTLSLISETVLWLANTFGLWRIVADMATQLFAVFTILSFGPLLLAWGLLLIYSLANRRWISFLALLLATLAYLPFAVLMLRANIFPVFLSVFGVVFLGMGWWIMRQLPTGQRRAIPAQSLVYATYKTVT